MSGRGSSQPVLTASAPGKRANLSLASWATDGLNGLESYAAASVACVSHRTMPIPSTRLGATRRAYSWGVLGRLPRGQALSDKKATIASVDGQYLPPGITCQGGVCVRVLSYRQPAPGYEKPGQYAGKYRRTDKGQPGPALARIAYLETSPR